MKGTRPRALMGMMVAIAAGMNHGAGSLFNKTMRNNWRGANAGRIIAGKSVALGSRPNKYKPHQGKKECARRVRQLMYGQIHNHRSSEICNAI